MKRILTTLVVVVTVIALLVSCGAPAATPSPDATAQGGAEGNAGAEAPAEANTGAGETIRFLDVSPGPVRQKYYEETFKKFEAETGIKVTYESVPWDDAANKLTVMGASGQLPDVLTIWAGWLGQFVPAGWVIPLDEYIDPVRDEYTDLVNNIIWKSEKENFGKNYTVPDGVMVKGVFYRKDWAAEKNITINENWTYDDYFKMIEGLYDPDQNRYGNSYRGARGAFDPLMVYLQSFTDGRTYDDEGNCLLNSPECVEGFIKWTDVYKKGFVPQESINWGFVEMVDNFSGGLTGTLINDSEVAATLIENMQPEQWGVLPMPISTKDGELRLNTVNSPYSYGISGTSKNPDASWKLIEFLTRPDNNIEYCKLTGLIPIKKEVGDDPLYGEDGPYAEFVKQLNDSKVAVPPTFGPMDITDLHQGMLHEEVQKYLLGEQSAEDTLNKISAELSKRMKEYLAENPDAVVETAKKVVS